MQKVWKRDDASARNAKVQGVLVAVGNNDLDTSVIKAACMLSKGSKRPIYAVHVIEMPWTRAVDEAPEGQEVVQADLVLQRAVEAAAASGVKLEPDLLQARTAGAAIVDEATARDCNLILLGLPYKRLHGACTLGDTVPYVLEHSPIEVWVIRGAPPQA
ncbi:MAG: universal stress protein [Chloroflexota bacterium]|nr:universal stress protein [Chloroflexota bacterium]